VELEHLALLSTNENIVSSLEMLLARCMNLKSLCLKRDNGESSTETILKCLDRVGDGLNLLLFHPLRNVSKLKTLQLHRNFPGHQDFDPASKTPDVSGTCDRFAKSLFEYVEQHSACRSLEVLVLGPEMRIDNDMEFKIHSDYRPARCYQKGRIIDRYGQERDWPYLIRLSEFRATNEYAEISDWYTEWMGDFKWMWRVPGRFCDD
jgi:hypothetical protein